jgi:probable rRNA maturation factor
MPFLANILNKQRRIPIDLTWVESMSQKVLSVTINVLREFENNPIKPIILKELALRGSIGITLVSNAQIKKLNNKWRNKNVATDVLSFPLELNLPPGDQPFEIGEIIISVERALEQANSYNHSQERELAFLLTHGILHVLGFDHENSQQEAIMFSLQRTILKKAGFTRGNK